MAVIATRTNKVIYIVTVTLLVLFVRTCRPAEIKKTTSDYAFRYKVDSGNSLAAPVPGAITDRWEERRNGVVRGAYSLLQSDGQVRSVDYEAQEALASAKTRKEREGGFRAVVRYWPGPQRLLSVMTLTDMMAQHPHPIVNTRALWGKDYDVGQPERQREANELFADLRAELSLNSSSRPPALPHVKSV